MKKRNRLLILLLTLVACFAAFTAVGCSAGNNASVTFAVNGGVAIEAAQVKAGEEYVLPTPTRSGYQFEGWYLSESFSGGKVEKLVVNEDVTVYAKWLETATLSLQTNGGSLAQSSLSLAVGANIYDAVKDLQPTKENHLFAYWAYNGKELQRNTRLATGGATLEAVYKVKYTVEVNVQTIDPDTGVTGDYEAEKTLVEGYAFAGDKVDVSSTVIRDNFSLADNDDTVSSLTISATPAENAFKLFFDRDEITVRFFSNYPDSSLKSKVETRKILYGQKLTVLSGGFECDGYLLGGWSDGENEYKTVSFASKLYDPDTGKIGVGADDESESFIPNGNVDLDAVWKRGIPDMFGGSDVVYVFGEEEDTDIYVNRGDVFFKAKFIETQDGEKIVRNFRIGNDQGKIYDNDVCFAYQNADRKAYTAFRYVNGALNENEKIAFDEYNGITYYTYEDDVEIDASKGVYEVNDSGYYEATFTSGNLAGKTIVFSRGTVGQRNAFQSRDEYEYGLGPIYYYAVTTGGLQQYTQQLVLSGFGIGILGNSSSAQYVGYKRNGDTLTLTNYSSGSSLGTYKIIDDPLGRDSKGFIEYNQTFDYEYVTKSGASFTGDGLYNGVYVDKDGNRYEGDYAMTGSSVFGGVILKLYTKSGSNLVLRLYGTSTQGYEMIDGVLTAVTKTEYFIEEKGPAYAEYYYFTPQSKVKQFPLIVLDETVAGDAAIYGCKTTEKDGETTAVYAKAVSGTYTLDSTTGLYTLLVDTWETVEAGATMDSDVVNYAELESVTFATAAMSSYPVTYWYSFKLKGATETSNLVVYENENTTEGGKLTLINGSIAVVEYKGELITGTYATDADSGVTTVSGSTAYFYAILNSENKTFKVVDAPFGAYYMEYYGTVDQNEYILFDGVGGATYHYVATVDGKQTEKTFKGTYALTGETVTIGTANYKVYKFSTDEYMNVEGSKKDIYFIRLVINNYYYALAYKEAEQGEYKTADGQAKLTLDGYFYAAYVDENGDEYSGIYLVSGDIIMLVTSNGYYYFNLDGATISVKGTEYGTYIVIDNQMLNGYYVELSGNADKSAKVYTFKTNPDGSYVTEDGNYVKEYIDENATYVLNGSECVINYKNGGVLKGALATMTYSSGSSIRVFCLYSDEAVRTFVNPSDMSVMVLDRIGNATRYASQGVKKTGSYVLISNDLFYYVNSDSTVDGTGVYKYNKMAGTAVLSRVQDVPSSGYSFYTKDFEALRFAVYGLASSSVDGTFYYELDEQGNIVLYKYDKDDEAANEYGFVKDTSLGKFAQTIVMNGKTYIEYDGSALEFTNSAQSKFPFKAIDGDDTLFEIESVSFTPTGELAFEVSAVAVITEKGGNKKYNASGKIIRKTDDNGVATSTVLKIGAYEFDITLSYGVVENETTSTFELKSETMKKEGYSNAYLSNLLMYQFFNPSGVAEYVEKYQDRMGFMSVVETYDENGDLIESYATAKFGEGTVYVDSDGKNLGFTKAAYTLSDAGYYYVDITGADGISYRMNFTFSANRFTGEYGYTMLGFTRVESLDLGNNVSVEIQRTIYSDSSFEVGKHFSVVITENGKKLESLGYYLPDQENPNLVCYIVRGKDAEGNDISTYYNFTLSDNLTSKVIKPLDYDGVPVKDEDKNEISVYGYSVSLKKEVCKVYYSTNGKSYVEISESNEVKLYGLVGSSSQSALYYFPTSSSYDTETGVYTIEILIGKQNVQIKFKLENDKFVEVQSE